MTTTLDTTVAKQAVDLRRLAADVTPLRHASGTAELQGPCPRCGGTDRLHVRQDGWFCRQCAPFDDHGWHDAIDWYQWLHGCTFTEALAMLGTSPTPTRTPAPAPAPTRRTAQETPAPAWQREQTAALARARDAMPNSPAYAYAIERGLTDDAIETFRLGFNPDAANLGPALVIPWFRAGNLNALRYRYLAPGATPKLKSEYGSRSGGLLYGGHALRGKGLYLVLCEGELNAISIWQVADRAGVDVLSLGGESSTLTAAAIAHARTYRCVLVWMDKRERAEANAKLVGGGAYWSEQDGRKTDANDHLQRLTLRPLLAGMLARLGADMHHLELMGA